MMLSPAAPFLLIAALCLGLAAILEAPVYRDRRDLLKLQEAGNERPITRREQWARRREHILLNMQKVMGPLPGPDQRVPLDVKVESEDRTPKYVRRKLSFASFPGERVPAWLLLPTDGRPKHPAVLALHQTSSHGKNEPVDLGGASNLHYGSELAERGYVVLAPDYPGFGEHQIDAYARGWQSGSMKAIWDNMRGIDLLETLPEVDPKRIGCLGHSLGGHNTLFTAAFDARIRALVSNCGFTAFGKYYGGNITGWTGRAYMPRIKTDFPTPDRMPFDFHEVVASLAPRAFLAIAPLHDDNFDAGGVDEVMAAARPVYALFGRAERLAVVHPDCAHDWPPAMREEAYRWLDRWLR
jgi:dienelactone hydrolase